MWKLFRRVIASLAYHRQYIGRFDVSGFPLPPRVQSALTTRNWKLATKVFSLLAAYCLLLLGCGGSGQQTASSSSSSPVISIAIFPSAASVPLGQSKQLVATVCGTTDDGVVWAINGLQGGSSATGTVSSTGTYLAPSTAPAGNSVTVAAISVADHSKSANVVITIQDSVAVSPALAAVVTGGTQQFAAAVNGVGSSAVQWMVNGVAGGNATVGAISSSGVYTAPEAVPDSTVAVTAVDASDSLASATAAVTVITPAALEAHEQWLTGVAEAAASYGCLDIWVQQQSAESIADVVTRFGLTANEGSCLVLWPISADPGSIRYSLAWGGMIRGKDILYISDVGQMRIWNNVQVATN
jgi:hypothetical protein